MNDAVIKETIGFSLCALLAGVFLLFPDQAIATASQLGHDAVEQFGLGYLVSTSLLVLLSLLIALSPAGRIRIGGEGDTVEFGFFGWIAMLFAAGMGSGLLFWGVAEPLYHYSQPPAFAQSAVNPKDTALALTYFHWGIHAWSIYAMVGLVMAWFAFNRGRPMTISASFTSGKRLDIWYGLDLIAVIAVIFGVAGTLANSIVLIQAGMVDTGLISEGLVNNRPISAADSLHDSEGSNGHLIGMGLLLLIALAFTASSLLGLRRGIQVVSQFNLLFAMVMLAVVFFSVDAWAIAEQVLSSTWLYITMLPGLSFSIDESSRQWSEGWSIIYLLWWIAWAPFVGPFIARISRGRSIRQFLLCAIFVPTLASIVWFSAFAGSAFYLPEFDQVAAAASTDYTAGLFAFFSYLPGGEVLAIAAILLLITFVITSADSAIYVSAMLVGSQQARAKCLFSLLLVLISLALIVQNNVDLNKQIAIVGAIPFTLIVIAQVLVFLVDMLRGKPQISDNR